MTSSRANALFLIIFTLATGSLALYLSISAPVGSWRTMVFDNFDIQDNADPDGLYLPSSVEFDNSGRFPFILGTPGITLHFLLYGTAKISYFFMSPTNISFLEYCAKNWDKINAIARCTCATAVIASVCLLFLILQRLGLDFSTAVLGSQLYFLSFPVLIYLTKITPEGLMVLFFLLNFWFILNYKETGHPADIAFSAFFCAMALGSKVHYLFPLPFLNIVYIWLVQKKETLKAILFFCTVFLLCGFMLLIHFDLQQWVAGWSNFISYYYQNLSHLTGGQAVANLSPISALRSLWAMASLFFMEILTFTIDKGETHFVVLSLVPLFIIGIIGIVKHRKWNAEEFFLAATTLGGLPVVIFRGSYHYWFFCIMLLSLFAARLITASVLQPAAKRYVLAIAAILSLTGIVGFVYAKSYDISYYKKNVGPYYTALHAIDYGQLVGIINSPYANNWQRIGGFYLSFGLTEDLRLVRLFRDNFATIDSISQESLYRNYIFGWVAQSRTAYDVTLCGQP